MSVVNEKQPVRPKWRLSWSFIFGMFLVLLLAATAWGVLEELVGLEMIYDTSSNSGTWVSDGS